MLNLLRCVVLQREQPEHFDSYSGSCIATTNLLPVELVALDTGLVYLFSCSVEVNSLYFYLVSKVMFVDLILDEVEEIFRSSICSANLQLL